LSGSTCLCDIADLGTLLQLEDRIHAKTTDNVYSRYLVGRDTAANRTAYANGREYIIDIPAPLGSILRANHCLPLGRMNDIRIELTLNSAASCLTSDAVSPTLDYNISDVELLTNYIRSQSLSTHFNAAGVSFHCTNYAHRYQTLLSQTELLRLSSAVTSLDAIVTLFRYQNTLNDGLTTQGKFTQTVNCVSSSNVYINNQLFRETDTNSTQEHFVNFEETYPHVTSSENFSTFGSLEFVLSNKLSAAPRDFDQYLTSGKRSSAMNSDITVKLQLASVPEQPIIATTFMVSTVLIQLDQGGRGDLRITY
jgi:hypothetical protein